MDKQGIIFTPAADARGGGRMWRGVTAVLLFLVGMGSLMNMLGFAAPPLAFSFENVGDGVLLLCNRLFAASEQRQLYVYDMFTVHLAENAREAAMGAAFVLAAVLWAVLCVVLTWTRRKWPVALCAAVAVGVQVYFGVFPDAVWNVALFGAFTLLLLPRGKAMAAACLLTAAVLTAGLGAAAFPGPSAPLYNSSEAVRDWFGKTVENPAAQAVRQAEVQRQAQKREEERRTEAVRADGADGQALQLKREDAFAGAQAGSVSPRAPWIAPVTVIVLAVLLAVWIALALRKAARRRALLHAPDAHIAIEKQFALCMECLAVRGLPLRNTVYAAYAGEVAARFPGLAEAFPAAAALWRECVYSGHEMTVAHREQMLAFAAQVRASEAKERMFTKAKLAAVRFYGGLGV